MEESVLLTESFIKGILYFLPVLFGAVEFIKAKFELKGTTVEVVAVVLFVLYGALIVLAHYFPTWGFQVLAITQFLIMCALAPSGFYKFIGERTTKYRG